jgi:hypothetical protein
VYLIIIAQAPVFDNEQINRLGSVVYRADSDHESDDDTYDTYIEHLHLGYNDFMSTRGEEEMGAQEEYEQAMEDHRIAQEEEEMRAQEEYEQAMEDARITQEEEEMRAQEEYDQAGYGGS